MQNPNLYDNFNAVNDFQDQRRERLLSPQKAAELEERKQFALEMAQRTLAEAMREVVKGIEAVQNTHCISFLYTKVKWRFFKTTSLHPLQVFYKSNRHFYIGLDSHISVHCRAIYENNLAKFTIRITDDKTGKPVVSKGCAGVVECTKVSEALKVLNNIIVAHEHLVP